MTDVTVTATRRGGESAVVLDLRNGSNSPISILMVTSREAQSSMIFYDPNMCRGTTPMTLLTNIEVAVRHSQRLGYRRQGAMLAGARRAFRVGEVIPLRVTYSSIPDQVTITVDATVVAPPRHLRFIMTGMSM